MINQYHVITFGVIFLTLGFLFVWWDERSSRTRRRASTHRR